MNSFFVDSFKDMKELTFNQNHTFEYCSKRFVISAAFTNKSILEFAITNNDLVSNETDVAMVFYKYSNDDLVSLFEDAAKELMIYSNFSKFNQLNNIEVNSTPYNSSNHSFVVSVKNRNNEPLVLSSFPSKS